MFTLIVASMIAISSPFSNTITLDSFTVPNLSKATCEAEAKRRSLDEKVNSWPYRSQTFISATCIEQANK